jgi:hypothetical protein
MYQDRMEKKNLARIKNKAAVRRLIADFMAASSPLEAYLQQGKPLTPLEL